MERIVRPRRGAQARIDRIVRLRSRGVVETRSPTGDAQAFFAKGGEELDEVRAEQGAQSHHLGLEQVDLGDERVARTLLLLQALDEPRVDAVLARALFLEQGQEERRLGGRIVWKGLWQRREGGRPSSQIPPRARGAPTSPHTPIRRRDAGSRCACGWTGGTSDGASGGSSDCAGRRPGGSVCGGRRFSGAGCECEAAVRLVTVVYLEVRRASGACDMHGRRQAVWPGSRAKADAGWPGGARSVDPRGGRRRSTRLHRRVRGARRLGTRAFPACGGRRMRRQGLRMRRQRLRMRRQGLREVRVRRAIGQGAELLDRLLLGRHPHGGGRAHCPPVSALRMAN
jgi:hypothetical protein